MQMRLANRDEFAWAQGEQAFEAGDTLATGVIKAEQAGYRAGCNGYAAFITAFSRQVRQYQQQLREQQTTAGRGKEPAEQAA